MSLLVVILVMLLFYHLFFFPIISRKSGCKVNFSVLNTSEGIRVQQRRSNIQHFYELCICPGNLLMGECFKGTLHGTAQESRWWVNDSLVQITQSARLFGSTHMWFAFRKLGEIRASSHGNCNANEFCCFAAGVEWRSDICLLKLSRVNLHFYSGGYSEQYFRSEGVRSHFAFFSRVIVFIPYDILMICFFTWSHHVTIVIHKGILKLDRYLVIQCDFWYAKSDA